MSRPDPETSMTPRPLSRPDPMTDDEPEHLKRIQIRCRRALRRMNFVISIDTEEDDWGCFRRSGHGCVNIERIPSVQEIFDRYGARPTYLITYQVAADRDSVKVLKKILDSGRCEIGSHCHPWNTPPFEEEPCEYSSMLCNLPEDLQYRKLETLHEAIRASFGVEPTSFRAGRWGFSETVARNLLKLGYRVDTSVSPFCDWSEYCGPDFTDEPAGPYFIRCTAGGDRETGVALVEIPPTIGFFQKNFACCRRVASIIQSGLFQGLHVPGLLKRMNLLNLACLSPEQSSGRDMLRLSRSFMRNGYGYLNMSFHSTSLLPGRSPFVPDESAYRRLLSGIDCLLDYASEHDMNFLCLSEAGAAFREAGADAKMRAAPAAEAQASRGGACGKPL